MTFFVLFATFLRAGHHPLDSSSSADIPTIHIELIYEMTQGRNRLIDRHHYYAIVF